LTEIWKNKYVLTYVATQRKLTWRTILVSRNGRYRKGTFDRETQK
jgi:hypothetical protein